MIATWDAPSWARESVFYQIFPDRFFNGDPTNDPPATVPWDSVPTRENFLGGDHPEQTGLSGAPGDHSALSDPFF